MRSDRSQHLVGDPGAPGLAAQVVQIVQAAQSAKELKAIQLAHQCQGHALDHRLVKEVLHQVEFLWDVLA